ncbi:MAG: MBL fold metallo-hydrolase [Rhodospirillaceae bacterium]|nr:MBL fold metallo-hydrolase [Rhodospirillaceae bacterium]
MADRKIMQVPGVYRRRIGEVLVTAISDGYIDAPYSVLQNINEDEADNILASEFRSTPPRISVNCYVIQYDGRTALVDTGSGDTMGPTLGKMPDFLSSLDVSSDDVDAILLTHMHPDHSNGLTGAGGKRFFANAELVVSERDVSFWHDDSAMAKANESQRERYFLGARFQISPYMDRLKPAVDEVFPHVTAIDLSGHTPGHTGYLIESDGQSLLIWGDICHVPDIQVRRPEVTMVFDTDPDAAIATRRRTFDMVSSEKMLIAGMHLHFPGFSYIVLEPDGYRIISESWAFNT